MSDNASSHTPADIITYVGVPLAVLGVLPILYNTFATLVALSRIKQMLRHSRLTALTRSDVVNRVIEIELPRYAVTPWDRFRDRKAYWSLPAQRSDIPGGTWTTFNWRTNVIGVKNQRVEYADQLRQPQVEIAFDELVCYLLDLGALPDPQGWKLLRSTGLWTPPGCALMTGPDGREKALAIAPLDDSDGNLSLSVSWRDHWTTRDYSDLPPYWVRLPPWPQRKRKKAAGASASAPFGESCSKPETPVGVVIEEDTGTVDVEAKMATEQGETVEQEKGKGRSPAHSLRREHSLAFSTSSLLPQGKGESEDSPLTRARPITCQISAEGLVTALTQDDRLPRSNTGATSASAHVHSLSIDHLRVTMPSPYSTYPSYSTLSLSGTTTATISTSTSSTGGGRTDGIWFASAVTAFGTTSQTVLWSYRIPDDVLHFARRETVPCGVLVLLSVVPESDTPEWSSTTGSAEAEARRRAQAVEVFARRGQDQRAAIAAERLLPTPAAREAAARERMRREAEERIRDMRDRMRAEAERKEARVLEALRSPRWDTRRVAERNLAWLKVRTARDNDEDNDDSNNHGGDDVIAIDEDADLKGVVGMLLYRMVLDKAFASRICRMLDLWKAWAENGGMRMSNLQAVQADTVAFALATLVVAMIKDTSTALEGTLSMDLQECLRMWRKVRLG